MPNINSDTLEYFLGQRGMTQADLIRKSKVGKATISRIFSGKVKKQNDETTKRIAGALGVLIEELCAPVDKAAIQNAKLREMGVQMLRATLSGEKWWNYDMVHSRYGISLKDQLDFAPISIMMLAEASLAERRKNIEKMRQGLRDIDSGTSDHLRIDLGINRAENILYSEESSIEKNDIFGHVLLESADDDLEIGFDPEQTNPFADFIGKMIETLGAPIEIYKDYLGMPDTGLWEYQIAPAEMERITGGDPRATMALNRVYVRLRDIPEDLMPDDQTEPRVAWLRAKLPEEIWAKHEAEMAALSTMKLEDLGF
jgi:transcriptional regulator with XRE-family HTH domain